MAGTKRGRGAATIRWIATNKELAALMGISQQQLYKTWLVKPGFPEKTKRGYNLQNCLEFYRADKLRTADNSSEGVGPKTQASIRKINKECEKLDLQIAELKRESIPIWEHVSALQDHANIVNTALEMASRKISLLSRDKKLIKSIEREFERARKRMIKDLESLETTGETGSD